MKSSDSESESESESDDSEDEEIIRSDNKKYDKSTDVSQINNMRRSANDATDGKTVFLKNVPFEAQNDDVKNCMEQFGEVIYALVCIDKLTEHSKGTAFVRFKASKYKPPISVNGKIYFLCDFIINNDI